MRNKLSLSKKLVLSALLGAWCFLALGQNHNWKPAMRGIMAFTTPTNLPPRIITNGPLGKTWFVGSYLDEDSLLRCAAYWENERWQPFPVTFARSSYALSMVQFGDTVILGGSFRINRIGNDTSLINQVTTTVKMLNDSVWFETSEFLVMPKELIVYGDSLFCTCTYLNPLDTVFYLSLTPDKGAIWRYPFNPVHPTGEPADFSILIKLAVHKGSVYITNNGDSLGSPFRGIVRYDGQQWHSLDQGIPGFNSKVWDFAFYQDDLYIGGNFNNNIYPNDPGESFARWNEQAQQWEDVGGGVERIIESFLVYDSLLFAIAGRSRFGDATIPYLAAWDGHKWCGTPQAWYPNPQSVGFYQDTLLAYFNFNPVIDGDTLPQLLYYDGDYVNGPDAICSTAGLGVEEELETKARFAVYPNPNQGQFSLEATATSQLISKVRMYALNGQLVLEEDYTWPRQQVDVQMANPVKGMYWLRVNDVWVQKVVVR